MCLSPYGKSTEGRSDTPLDGEPMTALCREFGISRKTGYKIFDRYQECGLEGLTDRSRRPYRYANQLPFQVENYILNMKREHSSWGARKIREELRVGPLIFGGRCRIRTCDFHRVKVALYR
jgi:hypothetical protein